MKAKRNDENGHPVGGDLDWRPIVTQTVRVIRVRSIRHDNCISRYAESVDTCPASRKASTEHPDPVDPLSLRSNPLTGTSRSYYLLAVSLRFALPSGSLSLSALPDNATTPSLYLSVSLYPVRVLFVRVCERACREVSPISRRRTAARHHATPPAG